MARVAPGDAAPATTRRRDVTASLVRAAAAPAVAMNRCFAAGCRGGVRFEGSPRRYVLAACCNGTGHVTQAKAVADCLSELGYECAGVILEAGLSEKLRREVFEPMGAPTLVLAGVQLVDARGAIGFGTLGYRGAGLTARLPRAARECRAFVRAADAGLLVSCWHYSLALLLSTAPAARARVVHVAPQFARAREAMPPSAGLRESLWRGGLLALSDVFASTGACVGVGDDGGLPPLLDPPPAWAGPPDGKKLILCYFLSAGAVAALSDAVAGRDDAVFHVFSDPVSDRPHVVAHAKSRTLFKDLFAQCDGVICSAGNETVWEAVCRGVRVVAVPTRGHAEQVLNAHAHAARYPALVRAAATLTGDDVAWVVAGPGDGARAASAELRAAVAARAAAVRAVLPAPS